MKEQNVMVWEEDVVIPTYPIGKPNRNPMFLEKRVYQGSSGRVYPHPVIDKIYDEKVDRTYHAVYLENAYLKIMVLPELGGRIQRATDKTNNYDFVYYNHVIKPALVGLAGPWISGGIEFNWPQHHRPSTYDPVSFATSRNEDGSCTVYVSEVENMFRTKGMAAFTLYPDKAYLEIRAQLYNRTSTPKTFLWWANPAVPVNDHTQSVFPSDVHAVMDHGKRAVSTFPIATGTYYKVDYSKGVDISRYKNLPVPTSYMAYHSDYDFVGGYDYREEAGILHVADHHISPGKKQWTWGCGEFGQAWDRNLTDEDGPYVELMTGCYTDNQPDFTWMMPYEEKTFTQYFMPYKKVGMVRNATIHAAVGLSVQKGQGSVTVYATQLFEHAFIRISRGEETIREDVAEISPEKIFMADFTVPEDSAEWEIRVAVTDRDGRELVSYGGKEPAAAEIPLPAAEIPLPEEAGSVEDLYLYGKHLEQYRHATYEPAAYYLEGLRREPEDARLNQAYGSLLFGRGKIKESEAYYRKAVKQLTRSNPNPEDGEAFYDLGLCLKFQEKWQEAYDAFYKAAWSGAWQDPAFYQLACLSCLGKEYAAALAHLERALVRNCHNMKARNLKAAVLRKLGRGQEAAEWTKESVRIDALDPGSRCEQAFAGASWEALHHMLEGCPHTWTELAIDYLEAGMAAEAEEILQHSDVTSPMVYYYRALCALVQGHEEEAARLIRQGEEADPTCCFPHRLEDLWVLEKVRSRDAHTPMAAYYLGNLWYDKKQYDDAAHNWEQTVREKPDFPTAHRNLALALFNKRGDAEAAGRELELAYSLDVTDSRVLMELDQLRKKCGVSVLERLAFLEAHMEQTGDRDDLYVEYITLLNLDGQYRKALDLTLARKFHPWEGGEGKIPKQYIFSLVQLARQALRDNDLEQAARFLEQAAGSYPYNLGEGKLYGAQENQIYYYLGIVKERQGKTEEAKACLEKASTGISEPVGAMYYNDQPPEMIYYQGAALAKLGRMEEADGIFRKLIRYGQAHMEDEVRIDYFAVSLPDLLIFEEDLNRKNRIHCLFMLGLGYLGTDRTKADGYFAQVVSMDCCHQGALFIPEADG